MNFFRVLQLSRVEVMSGKSKVKKFYSLEETLRIVTADGKSCEMRDDNFVVSDVKIAHDSTTELVADDDISTELVANDDISTEVAYLVNDDQDLFGISQTCDEALSLISKVNNIFPRYPRYRDP